jgi:hypothetical protein
MDSPEKYLTTKEFSDLSGIPVSSLRQVLRDGKLMAKKSSGKWMIPESQLQATSPKPIEKSDEPAPATKAYSIEEFAEMTFLTVYGVEQWLKKGLLVGISDPEKGLRVDAESLEIPNVKRLLR